VEGERRKGSRWGGEREKKGEWKIRNWRGGVSREEKGESVKGLGEGRAIAVCNERAKGKSKPKKRGRGDRGGKEKLEGDEKE